MSDKLLDEHRARHKLDGEYNGMADVLQHVAIRRARPRPKDVIERARTLPATKTVVREDGSFEITVGKGPKGLKSKLELAHMFDDARKLQAARAEYVRERQKKFKARGANGRMVEVHERNEKQLVQAGALVPTRTTSMGPGIPRCELPGGIHDIRESGRCWWCGKTQEVLCP